MIASQHDNCSGLSCVVQAETRLKLADNKGAASAYEQSMAGAPNIDILQNLAAAYVNDGKPQAAVAAVQAAGQRLPSNQAELAERGYGETEISLLLGRVYAQWPGHDSQALDIYDKLIQKNPNDFRYTACSMCRLQALYCTGNRPCM